MTILTNTINEISMLLGMNAMDLYESINLHNIMNEIDQIETEDEIRKHLVEVAFCSRMSNKVYSNVCEVNDNYLKSKLTAQ